MDSLSLVDDAAPSTSSTSSKNTKKKNASGLSSEHKPATKKENREGIEVGKDEDFPTWYQQVVQKCGLIEFYDISGCYILRPWSCTMWDTIREYIDSEIKKLGVENAYFPLFVSSSRLEKEKDHVEGFAAEVAWVTRSGTTELQEPIAVRPTSETIMYPAFAKWIRSHRDLPLKVNQWSNVVRWEFKHPTPFLRSREFLWQEGHTAYATKEEADVEVFQILDLYKSVYEDLLAVPVIQGRKSEMEKFAGGLYTTTVEGFIPATGRAIQGGTSHGLGQNFAKMFEILFEGEDGKRLHVWQNSWGMTTRTIGVMVMVHGDDTGLVLPPRVSPIQVVVIPITKKGSDGSVEEKAEEIAETLRKKGIRVKVDARSDKGAGWKFSFWEMKGVPIRLEIGPKDLEQNQATAVLRMDRSKQALGLDGIEESVSGILDQVQQRMLVKAREERDARISKCSAWSEFLQSLNAKNLVVAPWCNETACEENAKKRSGVESKQETAEQDARALSGSAKTLCIPLEKELERLGMGATPPAETNCFACEKPATVYCLWGRSY